MSKCIGCGIRLQNEDKEIIGYTKDLNNLYCERCFKTINYNEEKKIDNIDNFKVIEKINKLNLSTIFITDFININSELIKVFRSIKNNKILIINKLDIIPKNLKIDKIENNLKNIFKVDNVYFISVKKDWNLNKVIDFIEINKKVIICGDVSSGKSSLINKLTNSKLTTSKYANTTLDFIKIKYLDYIIYDTPGLIISNEYKSNESIIVKQIKLNKDYIYNIDGLLIRGSSNITVFGNNLLKISSKKNNSKLDYYHVVEDNSDIELSNGFIYIKNRCDIYTNKELNIRESIIGGKNECN